MRSLMNILCISALLIYQVCSSVAQDVIGCGGFIKSDVEINYSLIEVKLLSKQGALKYQTDCASINGYYMMPVYDKGEYSLVVEPPPGWSFRPQQVDLTIDGTTDPCSKGEDINFTFMGFGITGRVLSLGQKTGPAGVQLSLKKKGSSEVLASSTSSADGSYLFAEVLPGDYEVTASHATWVLDPATASVTVAKETGHAGPLTVLGYDVTGRVMSEGEPTTGVQLLLYSRDVKSVTSQACDISDVTKLPTLNGLKPLCHTTSGETGHFRFGALPCAQYTIVPIYHGKDIKFDLVPKQLDFQVSHNSVVLAEDFQVAGFSVSGRVVVKPGGAGVGMATVIVNDRRVTTMADGTFMLETMKAGTYTVRVIAEGIFFDSQSVKITPNTPKLPEIVASKFAVCGSVNIDKFPERVSSDMSKRTVTVKGDLAESRTIPLNHEGRFCTELPAGKYTVTADVTAHEIHAGLLLKPALQQVTVTQKPLDTVHFVQLRVRVAGTVTCVEACKPLQLALSTVDRPDDRVLTQAVPSKDSKNSNKATFEFADVMPGKYRVAVLSEDWCWAEKVAQVTVLDKDVSDVTFTHNGYVLSCTLSHDVELTFAHDSMKKTAGRFEMKKGLSKFCLEKPGVYTLVPESCHQFEQTTYKFDTSNPSVLTLHAVKHLVEGKISTETTEKDIKVYIKTSLNQDEIALGPLEPIQDEPPKATDKSKDKRGDKKPAAGPAEYRFTYWARSGETVEFAPHSETLLFYPESKSVNVDGAKCPGLAAEFEGLKGLFIEGKITPALSDVAISITSGQTPQLDVKSDAQGKYKVGPLHPGRDYMVNAVKEGYVLTAVEGKLGQFTALKLGEISVKVADENNAPLQGVLLSVSGVEYRSNVLTPEDGSMIVRSLRPGQYFVKPMMKEYVFEPTSQTLSVEQGGSVSLSVRARRVAYSCHGSVTSLNGEQEQGVVVEAQGQGACVDKQEEAKTEADGSFHIRGLQPECLYNIQLKPDFNTHIERAAPTYIQITVTNSDSTGVHIIAFRRMSRLDLSGNVKCAREHLQHLKVSVFKESSPDSPLHTISLGQSPFFHLPSLTIDNEAYFVRLESTLSKALYDYTLPEVPFVANKTFQHFTLTFQPVRKSLDQELSQSSFLIVPFTLLLVFLGYNYNLVLPYLASTAGNLVQVIKAVPAPKHSAGGDTNAAQAHYRDMELLAELNQMKKKKPKKA